MSVEPDELRYKEFKRSVRGYSPDDVDDLLDSVANELEELRTERTRLTAELDEARARIEQYESLEGSIRATLTQAEKAATDYQEAARREAEATVETARREAESIVRESERQARRMLADSSGKVRRVQDSYEALREARGSFEADFRRLLKGYLRLLDEANSATAREIEAPLRERLDTEAISEAHAAAEAERVGEGEEVSHVEVQKGFNEDESVTAGEGGSGSETTEEPEAPTAEGPDSFEPAPESEASLPAEPESFRRGRFLRRRG